MLFVLCVVMSAALIAAKLAYDAFTSPLSSFPGPFAAKITDIYRALKTARGDIDSTHRKWHEEYGSAVRIGPNTVSFSDPDLIKVIYSTKNAWRKSDMYRPNDVLMEGQRLSNIFNAQDNGWHDQAMKPIRGLWSMTKVLEVEPYVDKTLNILVSKLDKLFVPEGNVCKMDDWLASFAWDVTANVTFGRHYGFIEQERDVNNLIVDSTKGLFYFAPVSQIPWIDHLLDKNPLVRVGPKPTLTGVVYTFGVVAQYQQELRGHGATDAGKERRPPHYLDKYVQLKEQKSKEDLGGLEVDDKQIVNWLMLNILAGGDTTSATMRAVVYYLAKTPSNYSRLIAELDAAQLALPAQWKDTQSLPYRDAVIREAIRYNPGIAMILEREVPAEGMYLADGRYIPGGTKAGVNPAVTNRNSEVFGSDVDEWNADRWLRGDDEAEAEYKVRLARMKDVSEFTFGGGNRVRMGKSLARMEMYKLFGTIYSLYDINLADPAHEWTYKNAWFVYQNDMLMVIARQRARNQ
ncbi:benzoate 4-monooxygenase cytochrome-like protein P450 [Hortaea werneckii]|nr:benzoate 4-monooxygenase cytochrome-like protein P450 [Hortaea werneckii]KAI7715952.1 benzoate 4-monooxygenase cytochrome-like protein P450 [Hortaea werneckii]